LEASFLPNHGLRPSGIDIIERNEHGPIPVTREPPENNSSHHLSAPNLPGPFPEVEDVQPPPRPYTDAALLAVMEKYGLSIDQSILDSHSQLAEAEAYTKFLAEVFLVTSEAERHVASPIVLFENEASYNQQAEVDQEHGDDGADTGTMLLRWIREAINTVSLIQLVKSLG
jgi:hypothetical protein